MANDIDVTKKTPMVALLTPAQVAKMLGVGEATLAVWRCTARYPLRYIKVGRAVRYRLEDVNFFLDGRAHSGSDEGQERRKRHRR